MQVLFGRVPPVGRAGDLLREWYKNMRSPSFQKIIDAPSIPNIDEGLDWVAAYTHTPREYRHAAREPVIARKGGVVLIGYPSDLTNVFGDPVLNGVAAHMVANNVAVCEMVASMMAHVNTVTEEHHGLTLDARFFRLVPSSSVVARYCDATDWVLATSPSDRTGHAVYEAGGHHASVFGGCHRSSSVLSKTSLAALLKKAGAVARPVAVVTVPPLGTTTLCRFEHHAVVVRNTGVLYVCDGHGGPCIVTEAELASVLVDCFAMEQNDGVGPWAVLSHGDVPSAIVSMYENSASAAHRTMWLDDAMNYVRSTACPACGSNGVAPCT